MPVPPTKLELLKAVAEDKLDHHGRVKDLYGVMLACSDAAQALWIGSDVPDDIAAQLRAAIAPSRTAGELGAVPAELDACSSILDIDTASAHISSDISYIFDHIISITCPLDIELASSNTSHIDLLRQANPGNWHPSEWLELLEGKLGPWVVALSGGVVASLCHTPKQPSPQATECGVWTHPSFRSRGLATLVTAEWAALVRASHRYLFYSARTDNAPSRAVARRLQLRPLGYTWRLARSKASDAPFHPLSSLVSTPPCS